jgi:mannobiose 2-epimerase
MRMKFRPELLVAVLLLLPLRLAALAPGVPPPTESAPAGKVDPAEFQLLATNAERELRGNILPFWLKNARDQKHGGFHAFIGEDMSVRNDLPRGALLTCRILWTFSAAYRKYHDPEYLEMARWAYKDLITNFVDKQSGGLFWTIAADGKPLDAHKQIYVQVFGIYGLTEFYRATGEQRADDQTSALDTAIAIYRLIEKNATDSKNGGYFDALDREWHRVDGAKGNLLGEAPKSQNSHIHILEGFTNLLRVWPDPGLRRRQRELIELTMKHIIDPHTHHLVLFMQEDWTPIGDEISYGHDIELSWLLVEAAEELGDPVLLARTKEMALAIAQVTNAEGVDRDGGVYNEGNPHGPTNTNKEWWEQAEAAVGFLNAYEISGDPQDFAHSLRSWNFIQENFVDRVHGDWHNTLRRDCTPILSFTTRDGRTFPSAKQNIWKCPYHNSRCCLELIERTNRLATGTK